MGSAIGVLVAVAIFLALAAGCYPSYWHTADGRCPLTTLQLFTPPVILGMIVSLGALFIFGSRR